jgi:hypothetical protein
MHVLLPLLLLALIFLLVSCVGCTDRVLEAFRRVVHRRHEARMRHPPAPAS